MKVLSGWFLLVMVISITQAYLTGKRWYEDDILKIVTGSKTAEAFGSTLLLLIAVSLFSGLIIAAIVCLCSKKKTPELKNN